MLQKALQRIFKDRNFFSLSQFVINDTPLRYELFGEYKHLTRLTADISPSFYHKKSNKTIGATKITQNFIIDDMDGTYNFEVSNFLPLAISILIRHLL